MCDGAAGEECGTCPEDCGTCETCGDGMCSAFEDCGSCPSDCGYCESCGDGTCSGSEGCDVCAEDCGTCDYCGDGTCSDSESCSTCPDDCGYCEYCGDGTCGTGEDCMSCSADCGSCETCGDGYCDESGGETCESCESDCGPCDCTDAPDFNVATSASVDFETKSPNILGTYAKMTIGGSLSAGASAGDGECKASIEAGGSVTACASVLYQETCIGGAVSGGGSCTAPLTCEAPPKYTCDTDQVCCNGYASASLSVGRSWNPTRSFGPFECGLTIGGAVAGSVTGSAEFGPGCECKETKLSLTPKVTLSANGGASCGFTLWSRSWEVGGNATACASGGVTGSMGCGMTARPVGGAGFTINIPSIKIGWFTFGGFSRTYSVGDGC